MKRLALVILLTASPAMVAAADCRFVDIDDPKFSIVMEPGATPVLTYNGKVERYSSTGTGTGMTVRVADSPDFDPRKQRAFDVHEFDGHTFLTWGADLLVEKCR